MLQRLRAGDGVTPPRHRAAAPPGDLVRPRDARLRQQHEPSCVRITRDVDGGCAASGATATARAPPGSANSIAARWALAFWTRLPAAPRRARAGAVVVGGAGVEPGDDAVRRLLALRSKAVNAPLNSADVDGTAKADVRSWGTWLGREGGVLHRSGQACRRVDARTKRSPSAGPRCVSRRPVGSRTLRRVISTKRADRLAGGSFTVIGIDALRATVSSYRSTDPLSMPRSGARLSSANSTAVQTLAMCSSAIRRRHAGPAAVGAQPGPEARRLQGS